MHPDKTPSRLVLEDFFILCRLPNTCLGGANPHPPVATVQSFAQIFFTFSGQERSQQKILNRCILTDTLSQSAGVFFFAPAESKESDRTLIPY